MHVWAPAGSADGLRRMWGQALVARGLAAELRLRSGPSEVHGYAVADPFVPLPLLTKVLAFARSRRRLPARLGDALDAHAERAAAHRRSWAFYAEAARRLGWVAWPLRLGFASSLLVGMGRHARLLTMNLHEGVAAPLALAGTQKDVGRDFLRLHGLPIAPGAVVRDVGSAVEEARRHGFPVVLKRLVGGDADGVLYAIGDLAACRSGAAELLRRDDAILVEKLVRGMELRLHFVHGRLHRVYRGVPVVVHGDGRRSLRALLLERSPRYFAMMAGTAANRRRLVGWLWGQGVRRFADLARRVPPRGVRIQVAPGVARRRRVATHEVLAAKDLRRLERALDAYGRPSCGIDLVLPRPRAPLDGGAIFEINAPSGVIYLDDPRRVAMAELRALAGGDRRFLANGGRTPFWLVLEEQARVASTWTRVRRAFHRRFPTGLVATFGESDAAHWPALLLRRDAQALLIRVSTRSILEHGLPDHSRPLLFFQGSLEEFRRRYADACRTVSYAGGRLVPLTRTVLGNIIPPQSRVRHRRG